MGWADGKATGHKHRHGRIIITVALVASSCQGSGHGGGAVDAIAASRWGRCHRHGGGGLPMLLQQQRCLIMPSPGGFLLAEGWAQLGVHEGGVKGWADRKVTGRSSSVGVVVVAAVAATLSCQAQGAVAASSLSSLSLWLLVQHHCRHCRGGGVVLLCQAQGAIAVSSLSVVLLMPSQCYGRVIIIIIVAVAAALLWQAQGAVTALQHCHCHCGGGGGLPMPLRRRRRHHRGSGGGGGIVGVSPA